MRWRDIVRCLTDVDDGGCTVLFCAACLVDFQFASDISSLFSPWVRPAVGFRNGAPGECGPANFIKHLYLNNSGMLSFFFLHFSTF